MADAIEGYDIIGDLHGQIGPLVILLKALGYCQQAGVWHYPGRRRMAIFVGDLVDRNPHALEVVALVQAMIEAGTALAVMGNHEFNALCWDTADPDAPGEFLRPHNAHNTRQHQAFLNEAAGARAAYRKALDWFRTLPMWLDLEALRVVHAAWVPAFVARLEPQRDANGAWPDDLLTRAARFNTPSYKAVEGLLKGLETPLPEGINYVDGDGIRRTRARLRWWQSRAPRALADALLAGPDALAQIDPASWQGPWPAECGYAPEAPPVFCGHYWLDGPCQPLAPNIACVDYSAACAGNKLVAYRWNGEARLSAENFVAVPT